MLILIIVLVLVFGFGGGYFGYTGGARAEAQASG